MHEIDIHIPLTRIETKDFTYFSENTIDIISALWKKKEWIRVWDTIIPYNPYETTISKADTADRYIYFALPAIEKQHPDIAEKLKRRIKQMTKRERDNLTYTWIRWFVEREIYDKQYYS